MYNMTKQIKQQKNDLKNPMVFDDYWTISKNKFDNILTNKYKSKQKFNVLKTITISFPGKYKFFEKSCTMTTNQTYDF